MSRLAIHLNDAGITLSNGEQIAYREPGFAYLGDNSLSTGNDAFSHARIDPRRVQNRFWSELNTEPLPDRRFSHLSAADLVSRQLEQIWSAHGKGVTELVVAVPAYTTADELGLFLGIATELHLPVVAMVDAAVAATRREYVGAVPVHVDVGLHHATLTRMAQPGMAQTDRSEALDGAGLHALHDLWIKAIADTFVQQSRFDPLHTAATEQMLLDRLSGWVGQATGSGAIEMRLESGGTTYEASIESLALIGAAAPVYQKITTTLSAEDKPAIQVTDRVARLPGLTDMLKARVGGEVFVLETGATARGALARCRGGKETGQGVSLLRQLPWDQIAVDLGQHSSSGADAGIPTHVLFGHNAYAIGNSPLVLGSQDSGEARFVALPSDMPGISRKHCSLLRKNGQCVLEDHSRYGTFLNGHRVDGTSVLQVGDALRIGSPGFEFQLITTDELSG
jgi:hypothetical protein